MRNIERKQLMEEILASINALKNKMHLKMMRQVNNSHITHSQWFALAIIAQHKNMSIKQISSMLGITSSAGTQLVDALVSGKYVARNINTKDRRSLRLCILPKGQKSIMMIKKQHLKAMEALFKGLSDYELTMYLKLHKKILSQILK